VTGLCAPRFHPGPHTSQAPHALTAVQVASAYRFPAGTGKGQTIALIELDGGFTPDDLDSYFHGLDLPTPIVQAVAVDGGANRPGSDADTEVLLDIQVAGAIAPDARQLVFFAPNTDAGFVGAVQAAIDAKPCAISISWGAPETAWTSKSIKAMSAAFAKAAALGIPVFAAAGDAGADDGTPKPVADYPASDPNVIACGGTRLTVTTAGEWFAEQVWNDGASSASGGGYSKMFPRLAWQPATVGRYRGLPDISGNADPRSGYRIVVDGRDTIIGGTSAVAPLLAGLAARLAELGCPLADLAKISYANPTAFLDIVSGGNNGWTASTGWDPASGLGSPIGSRLAAALKSQPVQTPPVTPPAPPVTAGPDPIDVQFAADLDKLIAAWKAKLGIS
jgi:kumamolisin